MNPFTAYRNVWPICLSLGITTVGLSSPAMAQSAKPLQDFNSNNSDLTDVINNPSVGGASLLQLLNRIQLLDGRTGAEFAADQDENINSAVNEFRQKQRLEIQAQPQVPATSRQ